MNQVVPTQQNTQQGALVSPTMQNDFMMELAELKKRATYVSQLKQEIMVDGRHFGKVPGCGDKPTLLKNGAELLCMAFKLASDAHVEITDLGAGHREYTVTTTLSSNGELVATGLGSCSTMESKYRYRNVADFELTGQQIPKDAKEKKQEYRKKGFGMKKVDGNWEWVKFTDTQKSENPDIADCYNTVLKMASKRSLVDAVLKATGGSCEFTQDIEDTAPQSGYAQPDYYDAEIIDEPPQQQRQQPQQTTAHHSRGSAFAQEIAAMRALAPAAFEVVKSKMNANGWNKPSDVPEDRRQEVKNWFNEATANN